MERRMDLTYETAFAPRPDGRCAVTMAGEMARQRARKNELALPEHLTGEDFAAWRQRVTQRLAALLALPEIKPAAPVRLSAARRDGYRAEKWEFCPDPYTAVPFLALIPDGADAEHPIPAVVCLCDLDRTKEFSAGEPELDHPNCHDRDRREDQRAALTLVKAGYAVFVFDAPGDGECSLWSDPGAGATQDYLREVLCQGLLEMGSSYPALWVFQCLSFLSLTGAFDWVDQEKIALCAQGAGARAALYTALLSRKVKCLAYHDTLRDDRVEFSAVTEDPNWRMDNEREKWEVLPGRMGVFGDAELCAALAPRPLTITGGGADERTDAVRRAYELCAASGALRIDWPGRYADPAARVSGPVPDRGLDRAALDRYGNTDGTRCDFRAEAALALLGKAFSEGGERCVSGS